MFSEDSIHLRGEARDFFHGVVGEGQLDALGIEQGGVLLDQRVLGLAQNADEIGLGQRLQLHADGEAALQLGNQVARLRDVKCARSDEQNVVSAHKAVARIDGGAFDDGQNVALDAFAADVGAMPGFAARDFVDLVQKDDAAALDAFYGDARHLIHVDQLLLFFLHQVFGRFGDAHLALAGALAEQARQDIL